MAGTQAEEILHLKPGLGASGLDINLFRRSNAPEGKARADRVSRRWIDKITQSDVGRLPMQWARELNIVPEETPTVLAPMPAAWECDLSNNALRWTPGVFEIFGLPQEELPSRNDVVAMYSPASRAELERLRSHAILNCGSFTFDAEIRRPTGEPRWMRITADVDVRDGKPAFLYGLKQDITHLKR